MGFRGKDKRLLQHLHFLLFLGPSKDGETLSLLYFPGDIEVDTFEG